MQLFQRRTRHQCKQAADLVFCKQEPLFFFLFCCTIDFSEPFKKCDIIISIYKSTINTRSITSSPQLSSCCFLFAGSSGCFCWHLLLEQSPHSNCSTSIGSWMPTSFFPNNFAHTCRHWRGTKEQGSANPILKYFIVGLTRRSLS